MKKDKRILIPRDEFEEEAGEGLGRLSREEAEADLRELKARMERRVARPRAIWLPAAAAVMILLFASGVLVTMLRERSGRDLQLAQKESAPEKEVIADTAYIAMAGPIERNDIAPSSPAAKGKAVSDAGAGKAVRGIVPEAADEIFMMVEEDTGDARVTDEPVYEVVVAEAMQEEQANEMVINEKAAEELIVQSVPLMARADKKARTEAKDEEAKAVPARNEVAKSVPARNEVAKSVTARTEVAKAVPARTEATRVETARTEAAKVEAAREAAPAAGMAVIRTGPAPAGGWEKLNEWFVRNIRYPEGIEPAVRQEVVVSFMVQPDSTLTDLKAVSSPGEKFTREAFRLLREGPGWVPAGVGENGVAEEVVLRIVFK